MNIFIYSNNRRFFLITCSMIGVFCGLFLTLDTGAVIVVLFGFILGFLVILATSQPEDYKFLFKIFSIGFLSRLFVSTLFYFLSLARGGDGFLVMDDGVDASYNGWEIAKFWQEGLFPDYQTIYRAVPSTRLGPYHYWNGFVYYFTGWNPLVMFFINCLAGALSIILIYLIAKEIFNKKVAIISSLLFAFWPSIFLWSTMNSKEPLTTFFVCLTIWSFIKLTHKFSISYLFIIMMTILAVFKLRTFVSIILSSALLLSLFLSHIKINKKLKATIVIIMLIAISIICFNLRTITGGELFGYTIIGDTIFETIDYAHNVRTIEAGSAFFANVDISTPQRTLSFLPFGLSLVIFAPFPLIISSPLQLLAVPEMVIWYILLPFIFIGILFSLKYKRKESSVIIIFILLMSLLLALFEGNVGTLFRHRSSIIIPLCLIFAAAGLARNILTNKKNTKLIDDKSNLSII